MLREIYLRDTSDNKYRYSEIETSSKLETVLNKIRMILFTNRGEVMGYPDLGMDLEDMLFNFGFNESVIRDRFYAQLGRYVPEKDFKIDLDFSYDTDGVKSNVTIFVTVDNQKIFGIIS